MSWITTRSGKKFDLLNPTSHMVCIEDIAHALSQQCRFTGHTRRFYSIAQHSVHVSEIVSPANAFAGLMHDATEAYVNDLATPLKRELPDYKLIEQGVWEAIAFKYGLPFKLPEEIKRADTTLLMTERRDLMGKQPELWAPEYEAVKPLDRIITPWWPFWARRAFLRKFTVLFAEHANIPRSGVMQVA